jgi:hypothetical protein
MVITIRMFRSLYEEVTTDGFSLPSVTSGPYQPVDKGFSGERDELAAYFLESSPYTIPTTNTGMAIVKSPGMAERLKEATSVASLGKFGEQIVKGIANRFQPSQVPADIAAAQEQCRTATIDSVAGLATTGKYRCGWLYEKGPGGTPKISRGWLGSESGPLNIFPEQPQGQWFWDVEAAKQQLLTDTCAAATQCEHLGSSAFAGKCGFCVTTGRSIPIDGNGQPLYNNALATQCAPSRVIKSANQCPKPQIKPTIPLPPGAAPPRIYKVCDPLPGDRLRQDCLLQQVRAAGCSDDGSLATALATNTNPNDYIAELRKSNAFRVYQERSPIKFNDGLLKEGRGTIAAALDNFRGLHSQASSATADALVAAAKDLCTARGSLDKFDFCSELTDATPPPFSMECLQKEFKKVGGQPVGRKYPTTANVAEYQSLPNWGTYKTFLRNLAAQTKSDNIEIQGAALRDLLGIERESLDVPLLPKLDSYEAFYFNNNGQQFVGRRIRDAESGIPIVQPPAASCVVITDLRPRAPEKVRFSTSSAMIAFNDYLKEGQTPKCVQLKAGGGNITMISWYNAGMSTSEFSAFSGPCDAQRQKPIPKDWISMTQEYKAPVLSFEVGKNGFMERRLPDIFPLKVTNIYTEARGSNTLKAPANRGYITFTSPSSSVLEIIPVAAASFTTLTLCFRVNRPVIGKERVFTVGTATGVIEYTLTTGGSTGTLMDISIKNEGGFTSHQLQIVMGDWLLLIVRQTSQFAGIKNAMQTQIFSVRDLLAGTSSEGPMNSTTLSPPKGQPFHAAKNWFGFGKLQVGDMATPSAGMDISHFRLYDYDLTKEELKKDVADGWSMTWF